MLTLYYLEKQNTQRMQSAPHLVFLYLFIICASTCIYAGTGPCTATIYQLSDFGITKTYTLDNGTYTDLPDPNCGDYQGQDFWVEFTGPNSGKVNLELLDGSITDAAFEIYWNACSGLATSVGCFSNRNCGSIPMPGANIDVIPGERYHVRIFQEGGGGGTLGFRMSDLGGTQFNLGGSAMPYNSGIPNQNCIQLTTETNNQVGCAWFDTPIDFSSGFEINYQLYFGTINDAGADGIAFVFHTNPNPPCSNSGGQLGVVGIQNSFIVEFDTWFNGNFGDIADDHVAVNIDGIISVPVAAPVSIGTNGNVEDGQFHDVSLTWDPVTNQFMVFFDGVLKINENVAQLTSIFSTGTPVYWGLTGSTGGAYNDQIFCFDGFSIENSNAVETKIDAKICDGDPYIFGTDVLFDADVYERIFPAANGCDSTVTLTLELVDIEITGIEEVVLPCDQDDPVVQLAAVVTSNVDDSELTYSWDSPAGGFDSGQNTLTPIINAIGVYTLTVEYAELGCEEIFMVEVTTAAPPEVYVNDAVLGCEGDTTGIEISCYGHGEDVDYMWFDEDGNLIADANTNTTTVNVEGDYTVVVTDPVTGCSNSASLSVGGGGGGSSGPDIFYCVNEQNEIYLAGSVSEDALGFQWEPAAGLSDPNILNPRVLDLTGSQEFTLCVLNRTGINLVRNSNFAQGDSGFTSDYIVGMSTPGEYLISHEPSDFFSLFPDCDDHSEEDDQMMIIDGATSPNQNIWCQEIQVTQGVSYILSLWASNLCGNCNGNFPLISMTANGVPINMPSPLNSNDCEWQQLESELWVATEMVVEFCITNLELEPIGNDFAIDDIEMFEICKGAGEPCIVEAYEPLGVDIDPAEIACQPDGILTLVANSEGGSMGADFSWLWDVSGGGTILSAADSANPTIQGAGTYSVALIDNNTGCVGEEEIVVEMGNPDYPEYALDAETLTCDNNIALVSAQGLDANTSYSFIWGSGSPSGMDDSSIEVSSPGEYFVTVTNLENNCETEQSVFVSEDISFPDVSILEIPALSCNDLNEIKTLDGIYNLNGGGFAFLSWSTDGGTILSDTNGESVQIMGAGTYLFEVVNVDNGCSDIASFTLTENISIPDATLTVPDVLTCSTDQTEIAVMVPTGSDYAYAWATSGGNFISSLEMSQVMINQAGEYSVLITDNETGCENLLEITVDELITSPEFTTNNPTPLDCNSSQTELLINGDDLSIEWLSNPNIISGLNNNNVIVNDAGSYEVIVTNDISGCSEITTVQVVADFAEPDVEAGSSQTFGCNDNNLSLAGSSTSDIIAIEWQSAGGVILSGENTLTPSIGGAGTYLLIVTGSNGCTAEDFVVIEADNDLPTIDAPAELTLDCNITSLAIDATGSSSGADFSFTWQDEFGNLIPEFTTLNPTVAEAGTYQLNIVNQSNGCSAQTMISVLENYESPNATALTPNLLDCAQPETTIGLETSNADWIYAWSNSDGVLATESSFQLQVDEADSYTLSIIDQSNGCENDYTFVVESIALSPSITFDGPRELSCINPNLTVEAITDAQSPSFEWESIVNIASETSQSAIDIDEPGIYIVTVTDGTSGCSSILGVEITQNQDLPIVEIANPDPLTCAVSEVMLTATATNLGADVIYFWETEQGIFNSPNGTSNITVGSEGIYTLTVVNNENGCEQTATVTVEESISNIVIDIAEPAVLDCQTNSIMLNAMEVPGNNIQYLWTTTDGNIVAGEDSLNPEISLPGDYTLTVIDNENNCTAASAITVQQDGDVPTIMVADPEQLNCNINSITLNADGSSQGLDYLIEWSTEDGSIISGSNTLTPTIDEDGSYLLSITNVVNNCENMLEVVVAEDAQLPILEILPIELIDCDRPAVAINTQIISGSSNLQYDWESNGGNIIGLADAPNIEVDGVGTYKLTVIDLDNGCSNEFTAQVEGSLDVPQVSIETPAKIDCDNSSSIISLNLSANSENLVFAWNTSNGSITGDDNTSEILASSPGEYLVTITDASSNCTLVLSTVVEADAAIPALSFLEPAIIDCMNPKSVINTQTDQNGLIYLWETNDGFITSEVNGEDVVVNSAGTYILTVVDPSNNCENKIEVEVFENIDLPIVEIQPALELNCIIEEQTLSADGSSQGSEFTYLWTTQFGTIVQDESTLNPLIGDPGLYTLEILNTANNCVQRDSILIQENVLQPLAAISDPDILNCVNESITIIADLMPDGTLTTNWSTGNGSIISDPNEPSIEVDQAGLYELAILDNSNGCVTNLSTVVEANITPPILEVSDGFTLNCNNAEGQLAIIELDPSSLIEWFDTQNQSISNAQTISVSEPGTYSVVATTPANGCITSRTIEVLENDNIPTDLVSEITPPLCAGDVGGIELQEVIGGEGPYVFSLDGGQTFAALSSINNLAPGTINPIVVKDNNGCELLSELTIPNIEEIDVNLPPQVELNLGENYQIQAITNIQDSDIEQIIWTPTIGLSCTDCLNPTVTAGTDINYQIEIFNQNGCSELAEIQLRVDQDLNIYIPNAFTPFNLDGVNDKFYVFSKVNIVAKVQSLQVFDRWGNEVFINRDFEPNESETGWDGYYRDEKMQTGVYIYYAIIEFLDGSTELFKGDLTLLD